ncbi:MAG TPA: cyclic nucleotide-binding domain-containing protein [Pseudomonadales bacterium]|nr:cyclic nucleotide-binding domain-containing protein [Pseudomonadales bacterium]
MHIKPISGLPRDKIDKLLASIPFYRDVSKSEPWQYDILLRHSRIVELEPGETVLRRGDVDTWMYFVLKGKLSVYADEVSEKTHAINYITPGEMFGDLAMLSEGKRNATVIADPDSKEISLFGTDFSVFGKLEEIGGISLHTKLIFFRNMVHGIRWKLEVYKMQYASHPLVAKGRAIRMYMGPKDTKEELLALHDQAKALAAVLQEWNIEFGSPQPVPDPESAFTPDLAIDL